MYVNRNFFTAVSCGSAEEVQSHLELGRQLLAQGQYNDALSHYHAAVGKYNLPHSLISSDD